MRVPYRWPPLKGVFAEPTWCKGWLGAQVYWQERQAEACWYIAAEGFPALLLHLMMYMSQSTYIEMKCLCWCAWGLTLQLSETASLKLLPHPERQGLNLNPWHCIPSIPSICPMCLHTYCRSLYLVPVSLLKSIGLRVMLSSSCSISVPWGRPILNVLETSGMM